MILLLQMMRSPTSLLLVIVVLLSCSPVLSARLSADEIDAQVQELQKKIVSATETERPQLSLELARLVCRTDPERAISLTTDILEATDIQANPRLAADAYKTKGLGHLGLDQHEETLVAMREAESLFRQLGDELEAAKCLGYQGIAQSELGELRPAVETITKALEECRALGYERGVAATTNNLGALYTRLGEYDEALRYHLQSIEIERSLGRTIGIANNLNLMGNIHAEMENYDRAKELYQEALELYEELGELPGISQCLGNIGNIYEDQGDNDQALAYFERALEVARRTGRPSLEAGPLTNMGIVFRNLGEYEKALDSYQRAVEIRERTGERSRLAVTLLNMGEALVLSGRPQEAVDTLERVRATSEELGMSSITEAAILNLAEAHARLGDHRRAHELLTEYIELYKATISEEHSRVVTELQARYDAGRRREEIELLTKDNEIKELQLSRARLTAWLTVAIALLVLGSAALFLRRHRSLLAFWKKRVFIGPYRLGNEISSGGMGVVYEATNVLDPSRTVALKVIRDELAGDETQRKRFINEGKIIDSIKHPSIVTVYDRGEHNERLYIAMEFLTGRTMAELIEEHARRAEPLAEARCLPIMLQLTDALTTIHAKGIVHRDVKPHNIMVSTAKDRSDVVKLLDFGTAKLDTMTTLTSAGELVGTVRYLAPERIRHHEPSAAGDIFSLGVVFFELLTLQRPFSADDPTVLIHQLLEDEPAIPTEIRSDLSGDLSALVSAMLDKDPHRRPSGDVIFHRLTRITAA